MGLDMYLEARRYISDYPNGEDEELGKKVLDLVGLPQASKEQWNGGVGGFRAQYVIIEAGYWRKANHIHAWMIRGQEKDDCEPFPVDRERLIELRDLCAKVIADPEKAPKLLPTQDGFFFGSTDYDVDYFSDCAETIKIIDHALTLGDEWCFEYRASW